MWRPTSPATSVDIKDVLLSPLQLTKDGNLVGGCFPGICASVIPCIPGLHLEEEGHVMTPDPAGAIPAGQAQAFITRDILAVAAALSLPRPSWMRQKSLEGTQFSQEFRRSSFVAAFLDQ